MEKQHMRQETVDIEDTDFDQWEHEMTENMRGETVPRGAYTRLGRIKDKLVMLLGDDKPGIREKINRSWTGKISLETRTQDVKDSVEAVLEPDNLDRYYVKSSDRAPARCIDGRCISCFDEGAETAASRELGPQNPGGTVTAALCSRVAAWGSMYTEKFSLVEDIHYMNDIFDKLGYTSGGHIDDHAPENMTGCGAIDKVPEILERITDPSAQKQVRKLTRLLLGDAYSQEIVDSISGRLLSLEGMSDEYFMEDEAGELEYRKDAIKTLENNNPHGVEKLTGSHNEIALVINLVEGTTFHRDQFSVDNDNEVQLFNYDFWRSVQLAEKLYPIDSDDDIKNTENAILRSRYVTVRALFAVGTAMILTDGSIELIVRTGEPKQAA